MIELLTTISLVSGGILFLLLLLSIIGGLDLDIDLDVDADGGLGVLKSVLTFVSLGSWVVKLMLVSYENPTLAFVVGAAAGAVGVWVLAQMVKFMLAQQLNVNYRHEDALLQQGKVYLTIPPAGQGLVNVKINGRNRELKAKTNTGEALPTGTAIEVVNLEPDGIVVVQAIKQYS